MDLQFKHRPFKGLGPAPIHLGREGGPQQAASPLEPGLGFKIHLAQLSGSYLSLALCLPPSYRWLLQVLAEHRPPESH